MYVRIECVWVCMYVRMIICMLVWKTVCMRQGKCKCVCARACVCVYECVSVWCARARYSRHVYIHACMCITKIRASIMYSDTETDTQYHLPHAISKPRQHLAQINCSKIQSWWVDIRKTPTPLSPASSHAVSCCRTLRFPSRLC